MRGGPGVIVLWISANDESYARPSKSSVSGSEVRRLNTRSVLSSDCAEWNPYVPSTPFVCRTPPPPRDRWAAGGSAVASRVGVMLRFGWAYPRRKLYVIPAGVTLDVVNPPPAPAIADANRNITHLNPIP